MLRRCSRRPVAASAPLGVVVGAPKLDIAAMMRHKDDTVAANVNGVAFLFKKNKIDWLQGEARIAAPGQVIVKGEAGARRPSKPRPSSSPPDPTWRACPASRSTKRRSYPPPARSLLMADKRVVIIGGGIAGLAAAHAAAVRARDSGRRISVTVLERSRRFGGNLVTERTDGFVIDGGPDSWVSSKPEATALARELGLGSSVGTNEATRRYYIASG